MRAASAPYALFGGKPLEFERSGGKIVGVYTPNWQPTALVDALHGDSVTHVIYAFLHVCGPGQLPEDAPEVRRQGRLPARDLGHRRHASTLPSRA